MVAHYFFNYYFVDKKSLMKDVANSMFSSKVNLE